jgi:hypothetical protein
MGIGGWVLVAVPAVISAQTSAVDPPVTIQLASYQWKEPSPPLLESIATISEAKIAALYGEAAEEDRALAAEAAEGWQRALEEEDAAE